MKERIGRQDDDCDEMQQWAAHDERVVLVAPLHQRRWYLAFVAVSKFAPH